MAVHLNMELFKHTLFINLASRNDRLEHVTSEFNKMGINAERVDAIKMASGAIGCTLSHIKCLEIAKDRQYEQVFICEDDITFLDPDLLTQNITKFYENKTINWDVIIVSGNNGPPFQTINDYCVRVLNCQAATGYIVKRQMYDAMLTNFKAGLAQLIKDPTNKRMFAVDMYWKGLQMQYYWYMIIPLTTVQYENYSDIEQKEVNYVNLMLDLNKEWLTTRTKMQFS